MLFTWHTHNTHPVDNFLRDPKDIRISEGIGIVIVFTAGENDAGARSPSFRHLDATSVVSTKLVVFIEAGLPHE